MKNRIVTSVIFFMCALFLAGCGNKGKADQGSETVQSSEIEESKDVTSEGSPDENAKAQDFQAEGNAESEETANIVSIREEMEEMERKSLEYENDNWDIPQQEMNAKSYEWFILWDDELNSLWTRLDNKLSEEQKNAVMEEQVAWIKRKEQNVIASGMEAYGGTLQPLLENSAAKEMTRARAYELAEYLADALGESYTIPADIKDGFAELDPSLDSVFEIFRGSFTPSDDLCINVSTLEESMFSADAFDEGTKWVVWYTNSDVLTDADVYAYTNNIIIFEKEGIYYELEKGWEGDSMFLLSGSDLANMNMVGNLCNE